LSSQVKKNSKRCDAAGVTGNNAGEGLQLGGVWVVGAESVDGQADSDQGLLLHHKEKVCVRNFTCARTRRQCTLWRPPVEVTHTNFYSLPRLKVWGHIVEAADVMAAVEQIAGVSAGASAGGDAGAVDGDAGAAKAKEAE
jgi:hypothetical protein